MSIKSSGTCTVLRVCHNVYDIRFDLMHNAQYGEVRIVRSLYRHEVLLLMPMWEQHGWTIANKGDVYL